MAQRSALLFLFCAVALFAAALDGTWAARVKSPDGSIRDTYFTLHQNGSDLTGTVGMTFGDLPIKQGTVSGSHFSFVVESGEPAAPRRVTWEGDLVDGELHLKSTGPNRPPVDMIAKPVDPSAVAPPAKLPLPEPKSLPWNRLAGKPPMGWNSWNKFQGRIDDATVRQIADAMVRTGMGGDKGAGYLYVNIDDTWQGERDAQGRIHPNSRFPDMKALAAYVHGKGMLLGIYSSPGPKTCAGYEGSYGHERQDAETYADWGIDYLKYDWCGAARVYKDSEMRAVYQKMGAILESLPRPIVFSICQYGRADVWKWGPEVAGNLWRTTGDIHDSWESMSSIGFSQNDLAPYAGPGHWNDPDMLEIGNGGMTDDEYRVHMSLWAMLAAPLMAGNDVRNMSKSTLNILVNKEIIAVDRDPLGKQGTRVSKNGDQEIWMKPLGKGAVAVALFNRGSEAATMSVKWSDFAKGKGHTIVKNLWTYEFVKVAGDDENWSTKVPKHGVVMLRIAKF